MVKGYKTQKYNKYKNVWLLIGVFFFIAGALCGCGKNESDSFLELESAIENTETAKEQSSLYGQQYDDTHGAFVEPEYIYVYVCGAVEKPGVVKLTAGSRAETAVIEAGGMTEEADSAYINLAAKVEDGEKLFVPTKEEVILIERERIDRENGMVNINTADSDTLCTLPGIGESRAADIIKYRDNNGGFGCIEDIMKVSGIKTNAFEKIRDKITVE